MIGSKLIFSMKDMDGDVLSVELKHMQPKEAIQYESEKLIYNETGAEFDREAQVKWFDRMLKSLEYVYPDEQGEKIQFTLDKPIPPDDLKRLSEMLGMNGQVKNQLDLIPAKFKIECVTLAYDRSTAQAAQLIKKK